MSVRNKVPEYYRKKATFCRAMEKGVTRPEISQALQELASELETAADHMASKSRRPRGRAGIHELP